MYAPERLIPMSYTPVHFAPTTTALVAVYEVSRHNATAHIVVGIATLRDLSVPKGGNVLLVMTGSDLTSGMSHEYEDLDVIDSLAPTSVFVDPALYAATQGREFGVPVTRTKDGGWAPATIISPDALAWAQSTKAVSE